MTRATLKEVHRIRQGENLSAHIVDYHFESEYIRVRYDDDFLGHSTGWWSSGTDPVWIWNDAGAPDVSTPVSDDGYFYMVDDRGMVTCLDTTNGSAVWGPHQTPEGTVSASPYSPTAATPSQRWQWRGISCSSVRRPIYTVSPTQTDISPTPNWQTASLMATMFSGGTSD